MGRYKNYNGTRCAEDNSVGKQNAERWKIVSEK